MSARALHRVTNNYSSNAPTVLASDLVHCRIFHEAIKESQTETDTQASLEHVLQHVDAQINQALTPLTTRLSSVETQMAHVATQMASVATQMANMATQLPALDTRIAAVEAQIAEVHQGHQALRNTVGVKKDDDFIIPTRNAQGVYPYELNSPFPYHLTKNDLRSMSGPEKQRFANHYNTELNLDFNEVIFMWLGVKLD